MSLTTILGGCGHIYGDKGFIKSRTYDYVNAKQSKPIKMPANLEHKDLADYTALPKIGIKAEQAVYGPELTQIAPIQLLAVLDNTRVDREASVPSIFILDNVDFLWQTVEDFFKEHEISASIKDVDNHVIVSNWMAIEEGGIWLGLDGSEEAELLRAQYKISLSKGVLDGENKLIVERIKSQFREDDDQNWSNKKVTWQESADMMNMLLSFYDNNLRIQQIRHQNKVMAGFKVELGKDQSDNAALITDANEKLVWEKIPKVMKELGFRIIDKDTRQKTYFMDYEGRQEGFFASLFDEEELKPLFEEGAYQISIAEIGQRRTLTIKDGQGIAIPASTLLKLFPELSRLFGDRR